MLKLYIIEERIHLYYWALLKKKSIYTWSRAIQADIVQGVN